MTDDTEVPAVVESAPEQVIETPVVIDEPAVEITPDPEPSLITPDKITPDPVEIPPVVEENPVESEEKPNEGEVQSEEPAPLPTYDAFTLPEGITADSELLSEFTKDLAEFELTTKADHTAMQDFGQKLIDRYVAESAQTAERISKYYQETFEKQKLQWREETEKDPELGGNRIETTKDAAKSFIKTHGGSPENQVAFYKLMDETGLGNHPVIIRLLANAGANMQEGRPLPARIAPKPQTSKIQKRYGNV